MLVIYDLDKTSLYCPLSYKMDKCFLKKCLPIKLFYSLYNFIYTVELMFGLFKINNNMYIRAKSYFRQLELLKNKINITQLVVTARHNTLLTKLHKKLVFKDLDEKIELICCSSGLNKVSKAEFITSDEYNNNIKLLYRLIRNEEIKIIYEDNLYEINNYRKYLSNFRIYKIDFSNYGEYITDVS